MKHKPIALFCAFAIAAFAVVNTGFAKDASPPGSEVVQPNVTNEMPSIIADASFVAPVVTQETAFAAVPALSVQTRPPNRTRFDDSTIYLVKPASGDRCSLRPDH